MLTLRFVNATCLGIAFVSWQAVGEWIRCTVDVLRYIFGGTGNICGMCMDLTSAFYEFVMYLLSDFKLPPFWEKGI